MIKAWTNLMAGAAALATLALTQTGQADDFIARDRKGEIVLRDDRAGFGDEGQWTFSTDAALSIERKSFSNDIPSSTTVSIFPATDYFIIENLSLGGQVGIGYTKSGDSKTTTFRIGPRVGYNFELSRLLSIWPKLGFSFSHSKQKSPSFVGEDVPDGFGGTRTSRLNSVALNLFAPVMIHPAPHFFAGFGPFLDTDLSGDIRSTTWGFRLTLGGWI